MRSHLDLLRQTTVYNDSVVHFVRRVCGPLRSSIFHVRNFPLFFVVLLDFILLQMDVSGLHFVFEPELNIFLGIFISQ